MLVLNEQSTEPEACAVKFVKHQRLLEEQKLIVMSQEKNDDAELDLQSKFIILGGILRSNLFNLNFYRTHSGLSKFLLEFDAFEEYVIHLNSFDFTYLCIKVTPTPKYRTAFHLTCSD